MGRSRQTQRTLARQGGRAAIRPSIIYSRATVDEVDSELHSEGLVEDEEMDVEMASYASGAGNIRDKLEKALAGDFKFDGHFYYAEPFPSAPNPCLYITGPATIGLPLSTRDAEAIIKVAKPAPFGHGTETVIDKQVRSTWEIEPSEVRFGNQEWNRFLEDVVVRGVSAGLGARDALAPPKLEFYKLLLYETGSHFLPHQDTEKTDGMFATVVILLPSQYTGGQVHITHSAGTQKIDMAAHSLSTTSVLAWYTDVTHEVKPVTSGYRLALSYNLIRSLDADSESVPRPPKMDNAIAQLRTVLSKWVESASAQETHSDDFLVYLLKHQYSQINLSTGVAALKGKDAHLVAHLQAAGKPLGFQIFLGSLKYHISGEAEDYGGGSDDSNMRFHEVEERELTLEHIVDVEGKPVVANKSWRLQDHCLVPKDPFDHVVPDHRDYEGCMGKGAGSLAHWYERTAIVIVHKDYVDTVFLKAAGIDYALARLEQPQVTPLSSVDQNTMLSMIRGLEVDPEEDESTYDALLANALRWQSVEVWKEVMLKYNDTVEYLDEETLVSAMGTFSFPDIRPCLEELLWRRQPLHARFAFFETIRSVCQDKDATVATWCESEALHALHNFCDMTKNDIPHIIDVAKGQGIDPLAERVLPQLIEENPGFDFMIALVKALYDNRKSISGILLKASRPVMTWDDFMDQCLNLALEQLQVDDNQRLKVLSSNHQASSIVKQLVLLYTYCLSLNRTSPCEKIKTFLLSIDGDPTVIFQTIYTPLVSGLGQPASRLKINLAAPPLGDLLRSLVELYLHRILGPPPVDAISRIKKVGCGCRDCNAIDRFIVNTRVKQWSVRLQVDAQKHFEDRLKPILNMVTYTILPAPAVLRINKLPETIAAQHWQEGVPAAKAFIKSIGNDETMQDLMGSRYTDLQLALEGRQVFAKLKMKTKTKPALTAPQLEASTSSGGGIVAGQKRKRTSSAVDLGTIDLT